MILTQPQLLHIALNPRDVVYTPDDVARDVVEYFKPSGRILEPCAGDGAFLRYLPEGTEWCEIERGRDFFAWHERVDWLIGNPPYSLYDEWMAHSYELADNILYLLFIRTIWNTMGRLRSIKAYGGVKTIYVVGSASSLGWESGIPVAAVHFQRNYRGSTFTVFR